MGVARSLGEMFRAWNGAKVEYDAKSGAFSILANLRTKGQSADEMLFKTRINVFLTHSGELADADVDRRMSDAAYMRSVFARTGKTRQQFDRMSLDERRAFIRSTRAVGRTDFQFKDTPGSFRMSTEDLETMTAKVTLDVDAKPVTAGTAFHEAFHAVMGFVRATGVLSRQDIAVLQKKYGRALVNGQEWFNEEPAAMDYQRILSAELAPSPETRTPQGIWSKLKAFFSMLLDSIRAAFSGGHYSEDYGNDMRSNPLMQIMLTGTAESSLPGETVPDGGPRPDGGPSAHETAQAVVDRVLQFWRGQRYLSFASDVSSALLNYRGIPVDDVKAVLQGAEAAKGLRDALVSVVERHMESEDIKKIVGEFGPRATVETRTTDSTGALRQALENAMKTAQPEEMPGGLYEFIAQTYERAAYLSEEGKKDPVGYMVRRIESGDILTPEATEELLVKFGPRVAETGEPVTASLPGSALNRKYADALNNPGPEGDGGRYAGVGESTSAIESPRTILSNEELKLWNSQGLGPAPRILAASEHTDPAFHVQKILDIIEGRETVKDKNGNDTGLTGKDFAGLYLVTKHDGLPMRRLLETKIPKLIHFSITTLGGTEYEPGVMKYNDLLDRIGEYIKMGLDPQAVTIRIDPVVPGVTRIEDVEEVIRRASEMGIKRVRFSVIDMYANTVKHLRELGYDFAANGFTSATAPRTSDTYVRGGAEKPTFFASKARLRSIAERMVAVAKKYGVTLGTCAEPFLVKDVSLEGCLSPEAASAMLGTTVEKLMSKQRRLCGCYGGKQDALAWNHGCASHCVYCYARHDNEKALRYYDKDGKLLDNEFTRTMPGAYAAVPGAAVNTTPNPVVESSVAEVLPKDGFDLPIDLSGVETVPEDQFTSEEQYDVQLVLPRIRQALPGVENNRMAVPYSDHELLAATLGAAIRDGFAQEDLDGIARLSPEGQVRYEQDQVARMRLAIGKIADVFGVKVPADREALLFRGLCQLGVNLLNDGQCAKSPEVNLHLKGKPVERPDKAPTASHVTSTQLAATMAVASGVLPSDIVESALYDLRAMADRRGRGNSFVDDVLDGKLIPMFEMLQRQSDDPTGLLARFEERGDSPNELMSSLLSGLVAEEDADGNRTSFRLSDGSSDNTHQEANIPLYADHVDDPDFQRAIGRAADALYMLAASRNLYRDLGFTPGRPSDAAAFPGYDGTAKSPLEMAADLGSTPEQHVDPAFEAVGFFDQTWFSAMNPKMWLDSMLAESFGKVNVRDSMRGLHAEVAGYQHRIVSLRNLHAYEYGLSDRAGTGLLEVDADYDSGFKWEGQRIVHGERERPEGVRRYKNESKTRTKYSLTLNEQRVIDLVLKARRAWLAGGRKVITGVDGLTFSLDDSADPSHYTREKVMQRVGRGYGRGETDIDKALRRLDLQLRDDPRNGDFDWIVDGAYGLRERLVKGVCDALAEARRRVQAGTMERSEVNDFVIRRLDRRGLVCGVQQRRRNTPGDRFVSAAVALDADRIEELFLKSSAYGKLLKAGRRPEWLTREAYAAPYRELWREVKSFVAAHPFLSEGDGRFFHSVNSPVPFVRGSGVFMHEAARVEHQPSAETVNEVRTRYFETFERILADPAIASTKASAADADTLLMMRTMFHLPEQDVESIRRAVAAGDYADVRGLELAADGTVADVADAVYRRLVDMVWDRSAGTSSETALQFGGVRSIAGLVERYRDRRLEDTSLVSGGSAGMSDEMVYRMTGVLPANHQLGHALQNAIDGVLNSFAYRAAVINMATAPAEDGTPLCFVKPAEDAAETSGVPDDVWGAVARWQASLYGLEYNPAESGVENARRIYDAITEGKDFDKKLYGSINPEEMDTRAIAGFWARKGVPEGESSLGELAGGLALGYAKHLFQSTKALGGKYQRAVIHRAWAYAKAMNVSFSLFFPIATRFESPIGAVGALATIGGNISSDLVRKYGAELQKVWKALRGKGWITKDFIGETDFARMLDSNDPFLAEMYQYATAIGLTMTSTSANVIEHSRGILLEDLRNAVEYVHRRFGAKAAKKVDDIAKFMFVRGGEKAFAYHLNATKLAVAAQMCMKLQAEAARRGVMFDPVRDLRRYSSYINAEIGGVDPMQYAWMHPKMQSLMNTVFFSWNWTRGAWEAGGGTLIEKVLFGGHDVTPEETKYLIGRALRMWGWVAFGLPQLAQIVANGLALALNPDDDDRVVGDMKWFIWQHEDKAAWKSCDLEPLMRAIGRKFPRFAAFRKNHPVAGATPMLVFMLTRNPWLTFASGATVGVPLETEPDKPHRHTYFHLAKQAWEFNNWFDDAPKAFFSKLAMPIQRLAEGVLGRSLTSLDYKQPWADMGAMERWVTFSRDSALFNMLRAFVPFSVSGATDVGTSGLLPVVGPVSKGVSQFSLTKELEEEIEAWASDDRRGYAFGKPVRRSARTRPGQAVARRNVNVRRLLETAAANGYAKDRMEQYRIADAAIRNVANRERKRLLGMVPDSPDGEIDVRAWSRSLRKLQRMGALGKDLREGFVKELRKTKRWHELTEEQRREILRVMRAAQTNPYGTNRPAADY